MRPVAPLEIGAMFWAGRDPVETLRELKALGATCGQLGIPGDLELAGQAAKWKQALEAEDFPIVTVFSAYTGESYADAAAVRRTVGFIPAATRAERERRTRQVSDFAAAVGAPSIATHVGFVPDDNRDEDYLAVMEMVRRICDYAAKHRQTFALETGQEPAETLLSFILETNRENLCINFDPANMILYGTGDPIQALQKLGQHVVSVHCKDGNWPAKGDRNALGEEQPLGEGAVAIERFIRKLREIGYHGPLCIEREASDPERRLRDIRAGVELLRKLV